MTASTTITIARETTMPTYSSAGAPANDNNIEVWEEELQRWHHVLDLIEETLSQARSLASGLNLANDLEAAYITANRLAGQCALKVGRMCRDQTDES